MSSINKTVFGVAAAAAVGALTYIYFEKSKKATPEETVEKKSQEHASSQEPEQDSKQKSINELKAILLNEAEPVAKRNQCIFFIQNVGGHAAIDALAAGLSLPSVLLAHEVAYVLGQMGDKYAIPYLSDTLRNKALDPVVRHEAAEALAAIGKQDSLPLLEEFLHDDAPEVADTCAIAIQRMKWRENNPELAESELESNPYQSVDPAPGHAPETKGRSIAQLQQLLNDTSLSLFERYKAMFTLRNNGDEESIAALVTGFSDKSAVFRHEIAYVLGQLQHPAAVASLKKILEDHSEHAMVRHEAAEALGAIAEDTDVLEAYREDQDVIVKESCEVALSIADYWTGFNEGTVGNGNDNQFVGSAA